jgi:anti-sigma B factor antagonist
MPFAVIRDTRPTATVLAVHGELDLATVTVLRSEVEQALAEPASRLYLDLSPTTFIDSTGCRELVRAAKNGHVPVELVVPSENWRVRRVIEFMKLGELLPVHDELPPA